MSNIAYIEMQDGHIFSIYIKKFEGEYSVGVGMISIRDGQKVVEFGDESEYDARPAINYIKDRILSHGYVRKESWREKEYGSFDFSTYCNFKAKE